MYELTLPSIMEPQNHSNSKNILSPTNIKHHFGILETQTWSSEFGSPSISKDLSVRMEIYQQIVQTRCFCYKFNSSKDFNQGYILLIQMFFIFKVKVTIYLAIVYFQKALKRSTYILRFRVILMSGTYRDTKYKIFTATYLGWKIGNEL